MGVQCKAHGWKLAQKMQKVWDLDLKETVGIRGRELYLNLMMKYLANTTWIVI